MNLRIIFITGLIAGMAAQSPAARESPPLAPDLPQILSQLKSTDALTRDAAEQELMRRAREHLSTDDGIALLREAQAVPAITNNDRNDPAAVFIRAAAERADELYMPMVREMFPDVSPAAQYELLELLARIHTSPAAKLFVKLVQENANDVPEIPIETLRRQPEFGEVYFPALLQAAANAPHLGESIYLLALEFAEAKKLPPESLKKADKPIVAAYQRRHQRLAPQQKDDGVKWMWTREYQLDREPAGVLLDLMGYLPAEGVEPTLRQGLALKDPRLKLFAAISLIRQEKNVPYRDLELIAASDETRALLFKLLKGLKRLDLFPEKHRTQEALAQSCMVGWLIYPTELGRMPDAIELMKVVPAADPDRGDYYVFRFRADDPAKVREWLAGIAGPFKHGEPTAQDGGDTFSRFDKWSAATAEKHLANILDTLRESREKTRPK